MATIPSVVRAAAEQFAAREAVVDGSSRPTFADVAGSVSVIERALIASRVRPGDRVGLWAPNGLDWILTSFAVYGVGGILVPINTRYKGTEAADLLRAAEVTMLFTVTDFLGTNYVEMLDGLEGLDGVRETVVMSGPVQEGSLSWSSFIDRAGRVAPEEATAREAAIDPDDPSDIIFTSGTTGLPKGAVLRHGASVETYLQWSRGVGLQAGDRMLVVYPFFHTAGLKSGVLAAFLRGVTLVPHAVFEVESVVDRVAEEDITVLPGPPSIFQSILNHPDFGSFPLDSLRLSVTGAAVVPVELIARMKSDLRLDTVITAYGLTETHGTVTICEPSDTIETIATTVGHPLDGLALRIADDDGNDQPTGQPGEVLVRGFNVMNEYFGAPEATAAAVDADGWLRTGDVGYLGDDGYLRIVDRKKDILIVGGFNVSAAEVESIILRRDDVAQVAVVAAPDERMGEVGAAFVVPRSGQRPDPAEVVAWCREQMANFKAPRYVHLVDALPTTSTGKIQKPELRRRAADLVGAATQSQPEPSPANKEIAP
ncbi:MAG TPA: AMP-binding protein [Acidimicrobiales bacterium]|jgi:acyl-CoA synthetase (AMP-forming)/AMP-acid ligase II|nr:AMP-binding protein [Acidimicrobiales bacterium]